MQEGALRRVRMLGLVVSINLWTLSLLFLNATQIESYSLSVFSNGSPLTWLAYLPGFSLAVLIFATLTVRPPARFGETLLGVIVLLAYSSLLSLVPLLEGYSVVSRGDMSFHVSVTAQIMNSGRIPVTDFYPAAHLMAAASGSLLGLSVLQAYAWLPVALLLIYGSTLFALVREVTKSSVASRLALLLAAIPIRESYAVAFHPAALSLALVPLFLWLYIRSMKRRSFKTTGLFVVLAISMVIVHPLTAAVLLGGVMMTLPLSLLGRTDRLRFLLSARRFFSSTRAALMSVSILGWLMGFSLWVSNVRGLYNWLSGDFASQVSFVNYAQATGGLTVLDLTTILLKMYGGVLVLFLVSLWWYLSQRERTSKEEPDLRIESLPALSLMLVLVLVLALTVYGPLGLDLQRALVYLAVPVTAVAAIPMGARLARPGKTGTIVLAALVALVPMTALASYASPYVFQPNGNLTPAELRAAGWVGLFTKPGSRIVTVWPFTSVLGMAQELTGGQGWVQGQLFGDHLGYSGGRDSLGGTYPQGTLFMTSRFDILTTTSLWKATGRFYESDYARLESDPAVGRIYSNGDMSIWVAEH